MKITINNIEDVFKAKKASIETMGLKGYALVENIMADSSGWGQDNEMASTPEQLKRRVTELVQEHGLLYAKITEVGHFQVYVGLFKKTGPSRIKKIDNNTYKVDYEFSDAIRLHDTDILTFESNHVTLNSGGWYTVTTKDRMNKYLPSGVSIRQRDFEWFIHDDRDNSIKPFTDGITIAN